MYSKLCECRDGEKLAKKIIHWFLKVPIINFSTDAPLTTKFMNLLTKHINLVKTCFGYKEKVLLSDAMVEKIQYFSQIKAYDQSTSLLIVLAKDDTKLLKNLNIGLVPKAALKHALNHAKSIENLNIRCSYVFALYYKVAFFPRCRSEIR